MRAGEPSRSISTEATQDSPVSQPSGQDRVGSRLSDLGDVLVLIEIAAVLRTSTRTIKRHLRAGTFPIPTLLGIDKRVRFAKADVERFLRRENRGRTW